METVTLDEIRNHFYAIVNTPLQSFCTVGKFFGGQWLSKCGGLDGNKYVCLDKLYNDVRTGNCLIYSFGVSGDWSFEEAMSQLGCTVRAFDPTIDGKDKPATYLVGIIQFTWINTSTYMTWSLELKNLPLFTNIPFSDIFSKNRAERNVREYKRIGSSLNTQRCSQ